MKEQIRQRLQEMAKAFGPASTLLATVNSVDESEYTCELYDEDSDLTFFDVRLRPVLDGKESLTIIPKIDSFVLAVRIEDEDEWMLVAASEIYKWKLKVGNTTIEATADGIILNGGNFGGLIKIENLVSDMNSIKQDINNLKTVFLTTWTPVSQDGGAALKTAVATWASSQLAQTQKSNLEDTKVKH